MIFEHRGYEFELKRIRTTRLSIRRQSDIRFMVHGPKTMAITALKTMIIADFDTLKNLPVPFDYDAYLNRSKGHVFGTWKPWNQTDLKAILLDEIYRLDAFYKSVQSRVNLSGLSYEIKPYRSKFGSCHPSRRIIRFNQMLVHYPKPFIAAIFAHEIAHLEEPNHQAGFYQLLTTLHPTYRTDEAALKSVHRKFLKGAYDHSAITYP